MKTVTRWYSSRLEQEITMVRWGHWGQPVVLFPTAGGDAEEVERMHLIGAIQPLIDAGRIKVYSFDSVAGKALAEQAGSVEHRCWLLKQTGEYLVHEVLPAIIEDCGGEPIELVTAGASIGAYNAVAMLCRYPHVFKAAIGMSGTYDLEKLMGFQGNVDYYLSSPLKFLPNLDSGDMLEKLQSRFVLLPFGQGRWESPNESWQMAHVLGSCGIPNRADPWSHDHHHDWETWREMLPHYLDELVD
ncbi:esterase family protein [Granulosicoccus sp. 3-233]|uniref:esterase family protein n=1 Tax=Granulosicoccus sp. 3-233 TaxID=3417969 RepID=UPI003D333E46